MKGYFPKNSFKTIFRKKNTNEKKISIDYEEEEYIVEKLLISNNNKIKIIIVMACCMIGLVSGIVITNLDKNIEKVIIVKDGHNYEILGSTRERINSYEPSFDEIKYFSNEFIKKIRSLPRDYVLWKRNYDDARFFVNNTVSNKLDQNLKENNYEQLTADKNTIDVNIISSIKLESNHIQIRWNEKYYNSNGELIDILTYIGVLSYETANPNNEDSLLKNPVGLIFTNMSIGVEKK